MVDVFWGAYNPNLDSNGHDIYKRVKTEMIMIGLIPKFE